MPKLPERLRALLEEHRAATGSARAETLLADWPAAAARFVQLAPGLPAIAPSLAGGTGGFGAVASVTAFAAR